MTPDDHRSLYAPYQNCSIALHDLSAPTLILARLLSVMLFSSSAVLAPSMLLAASTASAQSIPLKLGNTPENDRLMLREVTDEYIFDVSRPPIRQSVAQHDIGKDDPKIAESVWEFVTQSTRLQIPENKRVTYYLEQYRSEAVWISRILQRASPFVGHIVEALDKRYLPVELALLPIIESGYRPNIHSSQDAAGIWQIVPGTADDIGITRDEWFDGRSDIRQSTTAAIDYLSYLNAEFHGDWMLTLAAYNAGIGRVRSAVKFNSDAGLPTDFWSLKLPAETYDYVPKFFALVALLRNDKPLDLELPDIPRGSAFDLVDVRQRVSLDRLAVLTGLSEKELQTLNAGLVHNITPPDGPHILYVPQGYGSTLIETIIKQDAPPLYIATDKHKVVAGDTISSLALRYKISQKQLINLNKLDSPDIRIGQTLSVFDRSTTDVPIDYVVTIGDTLKDIASRYSISVTDIRDESGQHLRSHIIHPGDNLSFFAGEQPD